jgi:hypothetical protein
MFLAAVTLAGCLAQPPPVHAPQPAVAAADGSNSEVVCKEEVPMGSLISRTVCRTKPVGDRRDDAGLMNEMERPHNSPNYVPGVMW